MLSGPSAAAQPGLRPGYGACEKSPNAAWPTATGRELSLTRAAFINALRAAANGE